MLSWSWTKFYNLHVRLITDALEGGPTSQGEGGGGYSNFSPYVGSGPASIIHPKKKNIRNFKHTKKYLKF